MPLGVVGCLLGLLPFVFDMMAARTPERFVLDIGLFVIASAVLTAIIAAIFVFVYNVVSKYLGGIELTLSK